MDWYFILGTERRGPVDLDLLRELRRENAVLPETLVWHRDLPSWQTYSDAVPPELPQGGLDETDQGLVPESDSGWYFIHDAVPYGPVSAEMLGTMAGEGVVRPESLVWHPALPGWEPYSLTLSPPGQSPPPVGELAETPAGDAAPEWYYLAGTTPSGPVDVETLHTLYHAGTLNPRSLVWSKGNEGWEPYGDVLTPPATALGLPAFFEGSEEPSPAPPPEIQSSTYGTNIPTLPSALRSRSSRRAHSAKSPPAGFFARVLCYLTDVIFIHILAVLLGAGIVATTEITPLAIIGSSYRSFDHLPTPGIPLASEEITLSSDQLGLLVIVYLGLALFYYVFLVATYGATPGKRLLRYRLATTQERPVGFVRATVRHFGGVAIRLVFLSVPLMIGWVSASQITPLALLGIAILPLGEITYLWALWDKQKRALHDHLAGTIVVRD